MGKWKIVKFGSYLVVWLRGASNIPIAIPIPLRELAFFLENAGRGTSLLEVVALAGGRALPILKNGGKLISRFVKQEVLSKPDFRDKISKNSLNPALNVNNLAEMALAEIEAIFSEGGAVATNVQIALVGQQAEITITYVPNSGPNGGLIMTEVFTINESSIEALMQALISAFESAETLGLDTTLKSRSYGFDPDRGDGAGGSTGVYHFQAEIPPQVKGKKLNRKEAESIPLVDPTFFPHLSVSSPVKLNFIQSSLIFIISGCGALLLIAGYVKFLNYLSKFFIKK